MSEVIERAREAGAKALNERAEEARQSLRPGLKPQGEDRLNGYWKHEANAAIDAFLSSLKEQAGVVHATVRDGGDEWHIECRMADGQKGAFITVDKEFEALADLIGSILHRSENVPHTEDR